MKKLNESELLQKKEYYTRELNELDSNIKEMIDIISQLESKYLSVKCNKTKPKYQNHKLDLERFIYVAYIEKHRLEDEHNKIKQDIKNINNILNKTNGHKN